MAAAMFLAGARAAALKLMVGGCGGEIRCGECVVGWDGVRVETHGDTGSDVVDTRSRSASSVHRQDEGPSIHRGRWRRMEGKRPRQRKTVLPAAGRGKIAKNKTSGHSARSGA